MTNHEWKIGDTVLIDRNRYGSRDPAQIAKIEKVTKTQFTAGNIRFKPWGGDQAREHGGDRRHPVTCRIATPERLAENDRRIKARNSEQILYRLSGMFSLARGDDAIRLADMLPIEMVELSAQVKK
jgi:hypothetical protein